MDELAKQLSAFLAGLKPGVNWAIEQAPLVVREKILYGRIVHTGWTILGGIGLPLGMIMGVKRVRSAVRAWGEFNLHKRESSEVYLDLEGKACWQNAKAIFWFLLVLASTPILLSSYQSTIMVWFAPRLYILEWIKRMVL